MFSNPSNVSLYLSLWLANDEYDHVFDPTVVTATELLKPIKSLVLSRRLEQEAYESGVPIEDSGDISQRIPSRMGTAIHDAVERSWTDRPLQAIKQALKALGYADRLVDAVQVNPESPGPFDIYLERRTHKTVGNYIVSGKYDAVIDGTVNDLKTTSTYTYVKGSNDRRYALQGSIYRWLNPDIITADIMTVQYVFTDWSGWKAQQDPQYPSARAVAKDLPLLTLEQTEGYIQERLTALDLYQDANQQDIPACTPVELWQDPPKFAYYSNPTKTTRASKLFDNGGDAHKHMQEKGGIVKERKGEPTFCRYCPANQVCLQAHNYVNEGLLKL